MSSMTPEQEAAAGLLDDLGAETEAEIAMPSVPPLIPRQQAAPEAPAVDADEVPDFTLDPDIPDEIADLLAEPDDDPDDGYAPEVEAAAPDQDEYEDPEAARLRQENVRLKKRADHLERENLKRQRGKWETEAEKVFPLAAVSEIQATTRKDFLRKAQALHEAAKPQVERFLQSKQAEMAAEAKAAWGRPVSQGQVPNKAAAASAEIDHQTRRGSLSGTIRAMMNNGEINL